MALDKAGLLAALDKADVASREVPVPDLGGTVWVREMTGGVRNRVEGAYAAVQAGGDSKALDAATAHLLSVCVVDESGRPMLTVQEARRLLASRPRVAFRLRDAVMELSAAGDDDVEAFAEVFGGAQSAPSTSG